MLKLTIAITPAMIPTQRGVRRVSKESGRTGIGATRNSTYTKAIKKRGNVTAIAILKGSRENASVDPIRDNNWSKAPI
jgi:hypothetical protein